MWAYNWFSRTSCVGNFQYQQTNIASLKGKPQEIIPGTYIH